MNAANNGKWHCTVSTFCLTMQRKYRQQTAKTEAFNSSDNVQTPKTLLQVDNVVKQDAPFTHFQKLPSYC